MSTSKLTDKAAGLRVAAEKTFSRQFQIHLRHLTRQLRMAHSAIVTSVAVLREQNADADADVARTLQRCAGEPLGLEIERMETLLGGLDGIRLQGGG